MRIHHGIDEEIHTRIHIRTRHRQSLYPPFHQLWSIRSNADRTEVRQPEDEEQTDDNDHDFDSLPFQEESSVEESFLLHTRWLEEVHTSVVVHDLLVDGEVSDHHEEVGKTEEESGHQNGELRMHIEVDVADHDVSVEEQMNVR